MAHFEKTVDRMTRIIFSIVSSLKLSIKKFH
jgi:hypothetical protein